MVLLSCPKRRKIDPQREDRHWIWNRYGTAYRASGPRLMKSLDKDGWGWTRIEVPQLFFNTLKLQSYLLRRYDWTLLAPTSNPLFNKD